jgi:hypothetical protein
VALKLRHLTNNMSQRGCAASKDAQGSPPLPKPPILGGKTGACDIIGLPCPPLLPHGIQSMLENPA